MQYLCGGEDLTKIPSKNGRYEKKIKGAKKTRSVRRKKKQKKKYNNARGKQDVCERKSTGLKQNIDEECSGSVGRSGKNKREKNLI